MESLEFVDLWENPPHKSFVWVSTSSSVLSVFYAPSKHLMTLGYKLDPFILKVRTMPLNHVIMIIF